MLIPKCSLELKDLETVIYQVPNSKAPGNDKMIAEQIKLGGDKLISSIFYLLQQIWEKGKALKAWKNTSVTSLYKGKGKKYELDNYRLIAIILVICRIYSKILTAKLVEATSDKLLNSQNCFRKDRCYNDSIFIVKQTIKEAFESNKRLVIGFIDLKKAYDSIFTNELLRILQQVYRILKKLFVLIKDLYNNSYTTYKS